jgi:hypothetical protein
MAYVGEGGGVVRRRALPRPSPVTRFPNPNLRTALTGGQQPMPPTLTPPAPPPQGEAGAYTQTAGTQSQIDAINALKEKAIQQAHTDAAAARQRAILDSGLYNLGQGLGLSEADIAAAKANPNSEAANLTRTADEAMRNQEQNTNAVGNLFYSSTHATRASDQATARQSAEAALAQKVRDLLAGITGQETGAIGAANQTALGEQLGISPEPASPVTAAPLDFGTFFPKPPDAASTSPLTGGPFKGKNLLAALGKKKPLKRRPLPVASAGFGGAQL